MATKKGLLANRKKISDMGYKDAVGKKHEEIAVFQEELAVPLTSADQHIQEVKLFVDRLKKMAEQFEEAGSSHRRQFSLQVQRDALQAEIKSALQSKADVQARAGITEAQNLLICQAFVDDVIVYLGRIGIKLNPLNVMQIRKSKWA